jgi:hypothetical protein
MSCDQHDSHNDQCIGCLSKALKQQSSALKQQSSALEKEKKKGSCLSKALKQQSSALEKEKKKGSVFSLLMTGIPDMDINPNCFPSIEKNSTAQERFTKYRSSLASWEKDKSKASQEGKEFEKEPPMMPRGHEPAEISSFTIPDSYLDFTINCQDAKEEYIKSSLQQQLYDQSSPSSSLQHFNEVSPQDYLRSAIVDVLKCAKVQGDAIKEATLFSLRPDLVVVVYKGRVLFAVEVKNPEKRDTPGLLFSAETAAGQLLAYLKGLKQQGIDQPFALLSTYNESVIVSLARKEDKEVYDSHLMEGAANAKNPPENRFKMEEESSQKKPTSSPAKALHLHMKLDSLESRKRNLDPNTEYLSCETAATSTTTTAAIVSTAGTAVSTVAANVPYDYKGRNVVYSQKFGVKKLYKVLTLLLESSLVAVEASKESLMALVPQEGDLVKKEYCTLTESGYHWETLAANVKYNEVPRFEFCKKFHVLCVLGQGGSGKCLLCSTVTGRMFALKLFLIQPSLSYAEEDRAAAFEESLEATKKIAEEELETWKELASPSCFQYCKVLKVNGLNALSMPFFPPLPIAQRADALQLVKARLDYFAEKGYVYNDSDVRWRHVGCRYKLNGDLEITLLDMGSLSKSKPNEVPAECVKRHIEQLEKRIGSDPEAPDPKPVFS